MHIEPNFIVILKLKNGKYSLYKSGQTKKITMFIHCQKSIKKRTKFLWNIDYNISYYICIRY